MDMRAILFIGAEPFEEIVSTPSTEGPMWNLVKIAQAVWEKKFKNYTILYMYVAQGQGQIAQRGQYFVWLYLKCFTTLITHRKF